MYNSFQYKCIKNFDIWQRHSSNGTSERFFHPTSSIARKLKIIQTFSLFRQKHNKTGDTCNVIPSRRNDMS